MIITHFYDLILRACVELFTVAVFVHGAPGVLSMYHKCSAQTLKMASYSFNISLFLSLCSFVAFPISKIGASPKKVVERTRCEDQVYIIEDTPYPEEES